MSFHEVLSSTPIADSLGELVEREIVSFHALPLSRARSIRHSALQEKYQFFFGSQFLRTDVTFSGSIIDSPILPKRLIRTSQEITSKAFGSKHTFYITMGTTISNYIAVHSLANDFERVLVDKSCHQSIHFGVMRNNNRVTYIEGEYACPYSGRTHYSVRGVLEAYRDAAEAGDPYKLVILNGSSYDGVIYDLKEIIRECLLIHDDVRFLIDEAWSSFAYFHPQYKRFTAMQIAAELQEEMADKDICIIATQSAHKSLSSIRQGSYLHVFASDEIIGAFQENKFILHTTSPSYPIMVSLELARAQAVLEGKEMIDRSLETANQIRHAIENDESLAHYYLNERGTFVNSEDSEYIHLDPLRLSINMSALGVSPKQFIEYAFKEHNVYINRHTDCSILLNVHIGIQPEDIEPLLEALRQFAVLTVSGHLAHRSADEKKHVIGYFQKMYDRFKQDSQDGGIANAYVIPYPPGVPVLCPDDEVNPEAMQKLQLFEDAGIDILVVKKPQHSDALVHEEVSFKP